MKVKLELDPDQKETEITIHAGQLTPEHRKNLSTASNGFRLS